MVTTNVEKIDEQNTTGVWLEEFAVPYITFKNVGYKVTVASPLGGVSPIDEKSFSCSNPDEWDIAKQVLDSTEKLDAVEYEGYDAIVIPGGHGPMFDLAECEKLGEILQYFYNHKKPIGAICHGPAAFITAKKNDGSPLIEGKKITALTNREEHMSHSDELVPFSLENKLVDLGGLFIVKKPHSVNVVVDDRIVTAQNAQSSLAFADTIWKMLG